MEALHVSADRVLAGLVVLIVLMQLAWTGERGAVWRIAGTSVLMIDIDFFKKVNDQYGHAGGDHMLRSLAQLLKQRARASDMTARWGGEEFLLLLPDTPHQGACDMAEQLRLAVQSHPFQWQQQKVPITISVGAATWSGGTFSANALIADADSALYRAKNTGRNRVCGADEVAPLPAC